MAAAHFQPAITSFGNLTLNRPRGIRLPVFDLRRHRRLLIGWVFSACFLAGLASLYALDNAVFTQTPAVPVYGGVLLDYD